MRLNKFFFFKVIFCHNSITVVQVGILAFNSYFTWLLEYDTGLLTIFNVGF